MKRAADFSYGGATKRATKPPATIEEIREKLVEGLNGSARGALNISLQKLYRRPVAKADLVVTVTKGPPDVLQMTIPVLGFTAEHSEEENVTKAEQKKHEETLSMTMIQQLISAIDAGELTAPNEPMPAAEPQAGVTPPKGQSKGAQGGARPPAPEQNNEQDFKSPLNTALQKLNGGTPVSKDDRIFTIDVEGGLGSLELPNLQQSPGFRVDCSFDPAPDLPKEEVQAFKGSVEHQLAEMALNELTIMGLLVYDPSKVRNQAWTPAPDLSTVPSPRKGEPPLVKLESLQDSFALKPPDEYKEQVSCRREGGGARWSVVFSFQGLQSGGRLVQGFGSDASMQTARAKAAADFFAKLERGSAAVTAPKGKAGGKTGVGGYTPAVPKSGKGVAYQPYQPPQPAAKGYGKSKGGTIRIGW
eukprot:TRINITY_DN15307_c0_g1_i1.p1 TRINITY_DN15307_c0_g1~~TRINITY_DN15307_c0_g1_i1.p1  ORF type:complete len:416 (+),score=97.51 TRINITY_DN15307_c0_g1_i1:108-1355(+)